MDPDDISRFFKDADFSNLLRDIRNAAWMRTGATILGQSVADYRKALIDNGIDPNEATALTVVTIQEVLKGISSAAVGMLEAATRLAIIFERMQTKQDGEKEVPS